MSELGSPFSPRSLLIILLVGIFALLGIGYLTVYGDDSDEIVTAGANSFSRSAIGHKAFVETMRRLGLPVALGRGWAEWRSAAASREDDLLVVAEPDRAAMAATAKDGTKDGAKDATKDAGGTVLVRRLRDAPVVLLVLPKWRGWPAWQKPGWISGLERVPIKDIRWLLDGVLGGARLHRWADPATFQANLLGGRFGGTVSLTSPQYLEDGDLRPIISSPHGMLVGERLLSGHRLWVISDPDLLSNQGIGEADNAVVAVGLIEALRRPGGTIVVDETAHGFDRQLSALQRAFRPPFVAVIASIAGLVVLLVWGGSARFGGAAAEEPALAAGKDVLIRNAAGLLGLVRSIDMLLAGYLRAVSLDVLRELHGPIGTDEADRAAWLDRVAERRRVGRRFAPLRAEAERLAAARRPDIGQALRLAGEAYHWKQEMLDGSGRGSGAG
jgi:hypothetical protein